MREGDYDEDDEGGEGEEWRRRYPSLRYEMVLTSRRPEIAECGGGRRPSVVPPTATDPKAKGGEMK